MRGLLNRFPMKRRYSKVIATLYSFPPGNRRALFLPLALRIMRSSTAFLMVCLMMGMLRAGVADAAQVSKQTDSMGREYFLFTPDKIDPAVTYWLVVEVHGYGGHGSEGSGVRGWADRGDCIGIAPSFPDGYQRLELNTDQQLVQIFQKLQKDFKLHKKLFVYGHSGGAQFAHRFTLKYPQFVAGCCATSAGSWSTGGSYGNLNQTAASLPIAISCGEKDTELAGPNAPMTRIEWAKKFEEELGKRHFFHKAEYWPDAGHGGDPQGNAELANEAFSLGTSGMVGKDRADFDAKIKTLNDLVQAGNTEQAMTGCADLLKQIRMRDARQTADNLAAAEWQVGPSGISTCMKVTQEFVAEQMQKLSSGIEKAGLDQVATIEKEAAPDALTKLQSLYNTFTGMIKVREAASQATFRLRAKLR
jgi:pimeloyl-ACP methyl ester carboxylesterase